MKISFLYTNAFSTVGGLQRFNQIFLKAMTSLFKEGEVSVYSCSLADKYKDLEPIRNTKQIAAEGSRIRFLINAFNGSKNADKIVISHINLLFPLVILIRLLNPKAQIYLVAHGIEVWNKLPVFKKWSLYFCHSILAVSNFTKQMLVDVHQIDPSKVVVLPNAIDPGFKPLLHEEKPKNLLKRLNLKGDEKIIFTFCKIESLNRGKGYDTVLNVLPNIIEKFPKTHFILAGKAQDPKENDRLVGLAKSLGIEQHVHFLKQLPENEIASFYSLCDVFVLPSVKEGFGIVFLEAIATGKIVIAGNKDGSRDALLDGELGILIDPLREQDLIDAITNVFNGKIQSRLLNKEFLHKTVYTHFGFESYCQKLAKTLKIQQVPKGDKTQKAEMELMDIGN
jgi:phosphatidyl-myo-inositol dimannoside synthase